MPIRTVFILNAPIPISIMLDMRMFLSGILLQQQKYHMFNEIKRVFWVWVWQSAKSFIVSESDSKFLDKSKKYEVLIGQWKFFHFHRASHWLFSCFWILYPYLNSFHFVKYCGVIFVKIRGKVLYFGFGLYKFGFFSRISNLEINLKATDLVWFDFFDFLPFSHLWK